MHSIFPANKVVLQQFRFHSIVFCYYAQQVVFVYIATDGINNRIRRYHYERQNNQFIFHLICNFILADNPETAKYTFS